MFKNENASPIWDVLWTYAELAEFFGIAEVTARKKVKRGELPQPIAGLGRVVRFDPEFVREWARARQEAAQEAVEEVVEDDAAA